MWKEKKKSENGEKIISDSFWVCTSLNADWNTQHLLNQASIWGIYGC